MICPFRSLLHMETDSDRRAALRAIRGLLGPESRFVFDVFAPATTTSKRRTAAGSSASPGSGSAPTGTGLRTLVLRVRGEGHESEMSLSWLSVGEWRALLSDEGFVVEALYGWFDRRPWQGGEDSVWVCRARS